MILLDSVTKKYAGDSEPALDSVSLHIEPNEFVFLVGKSGAGKSTLMKMITKEETPDTGKIIIGGIDLDYVKKRHIPGYRRRLGVVFQDFKLLPRRTVFENVAFALEIAGMSNKEIRRTVPKVLELVDLADQAKKFPNQLSGGQQQRVSIARSVARQPKILIADEPTANLDKLTTKEIIDLLKKINDYGTTVMVTTHNENIVNTLQKRVITLKDGRIVDDQKNNGIYKLDEASSGTTRMVQTPGHALRSTVTISTEQLARPTSMTRGASGASVRTPTASSRTVAASPRVSTTSSRTVPSSSKTSAATMRTSAQTVPLQTAAERRAAARQSGAAKPEKTKQVKKSATQTKRRVI